MSTLAEQGKTARQARTQNAAAEASPAEAASAAFLRDHAALLAQRAPTRRWVMYHRDRRVAVGPSKPALLKAVGEQGLPRTETFIFYIADSLTPVEIDDLPDV